MNIWGLVRASDRKQTDSMQVQTELILSKCKEMELPEPTILAEELGTSGYKTKFYQRPQGRFILREARAGDYLIVSKLDRLGRSTSDVLHTIEKLDSRGVKIIICNFIGNSVLNISDPMGKVVVTILALVAELESTFRRERVLDSNASRKARGIYVNRHVSYGRKIVRDTNAKTLHWEWDMEQIQYVAEIAERLGAGEVVESVAIDFLRRDLKDHRGLPWGVVKRVPGTKGSKSPWRHFTAAALWFWRSGYSGELPDPWNDIAVAMRKPDTFSVDKRPRRCKDKPKTDDKSTWSAEQWKEKYDNGEI